MHRNTSRTIFLTSLATSGMIKMQKQVPASRLSQHYKKQNHSLGKKVLICDHFLVSYTHFKKSNLFIYLFGTRNKIKM